MASKVSTGPNQPIRAEHIQPALGAGQLQQLASQLGMSQGDAASGLAEMLPQVVDKLSPQGNLPEGGDVMNLLKGFLG